MRILILNSEYSPIGGGAGHASAHIAAQLERMGHIITVVTSRFGSLPHREEQGGVTIYRIPGVRRRQDRSTPLEQVIFILSASLWAVSRVSRVQPQAALAFFGVPSGAVAWLIKKLYRVPYIISLRGGDVPGFRPYDFRIYHKLVSPLLRLIWKNATALVANSEGLRRLANDFDAHFDIPVIPNGVDLEAYKSPDRDWSFPRLLSAGRIVHQKGLDLAMRALGGLKELTWEWHIAGDGPQMQVLQSMAKELGIGERVFFHGWQSPPQLMKQYQQANLFLFPSRHEGMPNALLEAMASGLPVVASCIAGNEELVMDGKTGCLVPSEDADALQRALKKLLLDSALREQMGRASRQRVEENYSWESTAQQYALLLEQVK
ncbi:MAG TPA: glycosyltransferase family 4 protein [Anaerolineales bacterium]|jgi:glycosyltransferase involved in cell wall biosynthesis|nr:glycosyltransferase family 4 protein [Anaerolineales bacterium]